MTSRIGHFVKSSIEKHISLVQSLLKVRLKVSLKVLLKVRDGS